MVPVGGAGRQATARILAEACADRPLQCERAVQERMHVEETKGRQPSSSVRSQSTWLVSPAPFASTTPDETSLRPEAGNSLPAHAPGVLGAASTTGLAGPLRAFQGSLGPCLEQEIARWISQNACHAGASSPRQVARVKAPACGPPTALSCSTCTGPHSHS
jgi:hypothetical protein